MQGAVRPDVRSRPGSPRSRRPPTGSRSGRERPSRRSGPPRAAATGSLPTAVRSLPVRPCSPPAAARHLAADDQPMGRDRAGSVLAHAAGADLADLELCQFHPTALALPGDLPTARSSRRPCAARARPSSQSAGERFTDELAPRDQVTAAILDRMEADDTDHVLLDLRGDRPRTLPERLRDLPQRRPRPGGRARAGRAGVPLSDRRRRDRPRRAYVASGSARRRRVCLHRPPRREPPRLELPQRVLRVRRAGSSSSHRRRSRRADRPASDWRFEPPTEETRDAMWSNAGPIRDGRRSSAWWATRIRSPR